MHEPLSYSDAQQALDFIHPDCDRDTWFSVAAALKDEFGDAGWDLFDSWSQQGQSYNRGSATATWRSASAGHYGIATVILLAQQGGWERPRREISATQKRIQQEELRQRRAARRAAIEADAAKLGRMQAAVTEACQIVWHDYTRQVDVDGQPYLKDKCVAAHGIREARQPLLLVTDDDTEQARVVVGNEIREFFSTLPNPWPASLSCLKLDFRDLVVPMVDADGRLQSIQAIKTNGTKLFPKYSRKKGSFHVLGVLEGAQLVGFAEGYATAATCHELGTGWPVVACFDAGNMLTVAEHWHQAGMLDGITPVWLADNDAPNPKTGKQAGQAAAAACQKRFGGAVLVPSLPDGEAA